MFLNINLSLVDICHWCDIHNLRFSVDQEYKIYQMISKYQNKIVMIFNSCPIVNDSMEYLKFCVSNQKKKKKKTKITACYSQRAMKRFHRTK